MLNKTVLIGNFVIVRMVMRVLEIFLLVIIDFILHVHNVKEVIYMQNEVMNVLGVEDYERNFTAG
ncbi:hypothetical protein DGG96_18070 [Legionella qingyii]|uniref:Uncharacterized protein n=1 Tax=Legionella qingyii TaxID=2184757 RepID=A0A317U151_9GAMM|nr:hypothetical protein DGG96_18070 [Legionella qingyii]